MYKGPRLKTSPFAPFNKAFLPESMLRKFGFVKSNDMPYERSHATRETHQEYYKVVQDSMFGSPNNKILRVDPLREKIIISTKTMAKTVEGFWKDLNTSLGLLKKCWERASFRILNRKFGLVAGSKILEHDFARFDFIFTEHDAGICDARSVAHQIAQLFIS